MSKEAANQCLDIFFDLIADRIAYYSREVDGWNWSRWFPPPLTWISMRAVDAVVGVEIGNHSADWRIGFGNDPPEKWHVVKGKPIDYRPEQYLDGSCRGRGIHLSRVEK